jgi:glutamyl-tRNA synthetase
VLRRRAFSVTSGVVTRIAPSPTGSMHIGTARTALFNWLYARHTGGKFLLRVEDTDRARSTEAAVQVIFEGLEWLGLQPDEAPVFQFARADRHREAADQLLASGGAYRCYMSADDLEAERARAREEGRAVRSPWRDRPAGDAPDGPFAVRFRMPDEGETVIDDLVKGSVRFANWEVEDLVLLRSDGAPTYNLAVVVDDHDMGVTHVIRGDDHMNNTPKQARLYEALGWPLPTFAHLPMIHGEDGAKLSKRHGAQAVREFADMGYLPEGMRNYLARLGWSHGDDELFDDAQAIAWFDVKDVVPSPARLDWQKLGHVNAHHIRLADDARLAALTLDVHRGRGRAVSSDQEAKLWTIMPFIKGSARTVLELADKSAFVLMPRPLGLDDKARAALSDEVKGRLGRLADRLRAVPNWSAPALEAELKAFAEAEGVGMGKFGPGLRAALTAGTPSPDLAAILATLGPNEALARLEDALSHAA